MLDDGADIIDLGGESTRPGAEPVSVQEEQDRVIPVLELLRDRFDAIYSVDTSTPAVMTAAADNGAHLINDVRALQREGALEAAATTGLPVCLMHMQNQPDSIHAKPSVSGCCQRSHRVSAAAPRTMFGCGYRCATASTGSDLALVKHCRII